jgi:hypothetical protein
MGDGRMPVLRMSAVCGLIGIISGFLTPHISEALRDVLPDWAIIDVPISTWLAGLAFGLALTATLAWLLTFQPRQFLIIPFVLVGWFCAMQVCIWTGAQEPKAFAQTSAEADRADHCSRPDGDGRGGAAQASAQCVQLFPLATAGATADPNRYWQSLGAFAAAGTLGALITALGIPFATRRTLARPSYVTITLTGAIIAALWFVLAGTFAALAADHNWYALFAPWQAAVAVAVGWAVISPSA